MTNPLLLISFVLATTVTDPLVVMSDRGGKVIDRVHEVRELKREGRRVEIRGNVCYSSCTMYLGLPDVCTLPSTTFGFHGPSRGGVEVGREEFEYYSTLISNHYPEPLKSWYISKARYRISGVYKVKGSELIRLGIEECV